MVSFSRDRDSHGDPLAEPSGRHRCIRVGCFSCQSFISAGFTRSLASQRSQRLGIGWGNGLSLQIWTAMFGWPPSPFGQVLLFDTRLTALMQTGALALGVCVDSVHFWSSVSVCHRIWFDRFLHWRADHVCRFRVSLQCNSRGVVLVACRCMDEVEVWGPCRVNLEDFEAQRRRGRREKGIQFFTERGPLEERLFSSIAC